jgi:hypothetical protein
MSRPGHPRSPRHRRPQDAAAQEPPREDPAPDDSTPAQAASGGGALDAAVPRRTVLLGAAGAVGAAVLESLRLPKPLAGTTELAGAAPVHGWGRPRASWASDRRSSGRAATSAPSHP